MTEFDLTYDPEKKRLYLKEEVSKILAEAGRKKKGSETIKGLANAETVLLYPDGSDYGTILKSLEVLKQDLILRKERQDSNNKPEPEKQAAQ
jgi:hypothetical protein